MTLALDHTSDLGLAILAYPPYGSLLKPGACALRVQGAAEQMARAEEELLGLLGKPSGVATAANHFATLAGARARIVCVAWKKVAPEIRKQLREAIWVAGAAVMGHPAASVAWLTNKLEGFGIALEEGEIILSGAITAAVDARAADNFLISFAGLGTVGVRFV